jgi:fructokinase
MTNQSQRKQARPFIFGEVLFDCFPDGSRVLGGAPFNVAWHLQAFGLSPLFISRVGNDPLGLQIKSAMLDWGMDTSALQMDSTHPTGIVDITFNDSEPAYEIVENSAWDFIHPDSTPPDEQCSLLYHGSLALRNAQSAKALDTLIASCSEQIVIDINLRPPWWQAAHITKLIRKGQWLKLNEDELGLILPQLSNTEDRIKFLFETYPLQLLIVTLGEKGALAITRNGEKLAIKPEKSTTVIDTVGAGDAFCSILLLGKIKQWPLQDTLNRAQNFASAIVGNRGATVSNKEFYQSFIDDWKLTPIAV